MADENPSPRPVQVFLDTRRFIRLEEPRGGGGAKDFFAGNDRGFKEHKKRIRSRLQAVSVAIKSQREAAGFMRVQMREDALAKSYRPLHALFTESHGFALVGSGRVGEMIFQATPRALDRLDKLVEERAELTPRRVLNEETNEYELRVSAYRSEVGAIAELSLHDQGDRVAFTAEEAVAWMRQPNVIGGYLVELFRPRPEYVPAQGIEQLMAGFAEALASLPSGIQVRPFRTEGAVRSLGEPTLAVSVQLLQDRGRKDIRLPGLVVGSETTEALALSAPRVVHASDFDPRHHQALLDLLSGQTLVRSVELPPLVEAAPASVPSPTRSPLIVPPQPNGSYPIVGIIDGGVADNKHLAPWRAGGSGFVAASDRDETHGTFIAGLVSAGAALNPRLAVELEPHGCKFYDLDIFPRRELRQRYFGGDIDYFFDLLDEKIKIAKRQHKVRVFNLSFALRVPGPRLGYSPLAERLDRLARANDVILIVSAGNLPQGQTRPPWSSNANDVVAMLAAFGAGEQQILPPAEHLLGLTVGAVNPPGLKGHEPGMPTTYTRRGPGIGGSRKPDVASFGGIEPNAGTGNRTGLTSLSPTGECVENCGTSFAAPNIAATVATLDHRLEQAQPREVLLALPLHRASRGRALSHASLRHISREFVGFGIVPACEQLLADDPFAITLVFNDVLPRGHKLEFPFAWPAALTKSGSCTGRVDIALAYTPPIDAAHKDEAQRVLLEAHLYQEAIDEETGGTVWETQLDQDGCGVPQGMNKTERYQLVTGLKWSPIKRYSANMPKGRGKSSNWMLSVDSLTRAGSRFPDEGVPFALVMTIADPKRSHPIHDAVRNSLQNRGFTLADITVAHRVRPRK
ncbi:MAG: S8 family peptidase [Xanthobacteraceae bacterium]|nr:S8 family peptidase [Xanthobacteraceae bacterium]